MLTDSLVNLAVFHYREEFKRSDSLVFAALASLAMCETIHPSIAWLEKKTRLSRQGVKDSIKRLEGAGALAVTRRNRDGIDITSRYLLIWEKYLDDDGVSDYNKILSLLPEGHRLAHTPGEDTPVQDVKPVTKERKSKKYSAQSSVLAGEVARSVKVRTGVEPKVTETWLKQADGILRIDGIPIEDARRALQYASTHEFWGKIIISPNSLRKHMTKLLAGTRTSTPSMLLKEMAQAGPLEEDQWLAPRELLSPSTPF